MCERKQTGWFLHLGGKRGVDGKKDYARQANGLREVYTDAEAQDALADARANHPNANLRPAFGPISPRAVQAAVDAILTAPTDDAMMNVGSRVSNAVSNRQGIITRVVIDAYVVSPDDAQVQEHWAKELCMPAANDAQATTPNLLGQGVDPATIPADHDSITDEMYDRFSAEQRVVWSKNSCRRPGDLLPYPKPTA